MAIIKCKMCGGDMEISQDKTFGVCEYCGSTMTLPKVDSEQRAAIFNRGNHFRRTCDFDKALAVYEQIVSEDDTDAEAHWCCALCRFGIEYVEDPATMEYIPTCHRASFDSFLEDVDYLAAVEHSDGMTRRQYQKDAAKIAEVQRGILATSQTADPFDVFICYKETDEKGERTRDSMLAQEIYYQLVEEGYRVFFSRITLEDVVGTQYEPYIFAALNSAKVMVAVGTTGEHLNAVWVKNEWSRFLALMKKDRSKLLLPCYRDMDPYDLPEQLGVLQSYDMSKIGFMQDLIRGISKVLGAADKAVAAEPVVQVAAASAGTGSLLERVDIFLEDGDWTSADEYCEKVLDIDPKNAQAYLGKLLAELKVKRQEELRNCPNPFDNSGNYQKVLRFGDEATKTMLTQCVEYIKDRNEKARLEGIYNKAQAMLEQADTEEQYLQAAELFESVRDYKDAAQQGQICREKAEECRQAAEAAERERKEKAAAEEREQKERVETTRKDGILSTARSRMKVGTREFYVKAAELLESIPGWRDADELLAKCKQGIAELDAEAAAEQKAKEEARAKARKRNKLLAILVSTGVAAVVAVSILLDAVILPAVKYAKAEELLAAGELQQAAIAYSLVGNWKDAAERSLQVWRELPDRGTMLAAGGYHTVGLKTDGTVAAIGYNRYKQCDVSGWTDIVAVAAGEFHTVGLKADGTVVAVGDNEYGQCDVTAYREVNALNNWVDVVAVSAGRYHTVGLKADGTVVAVGNNEYDQCAVSGWTDIVAVFTGGNHTVGLKADGTVVAVGNNEYAQCDVSGWQDIVAVSAGNVHTVGLKSDGTVVAVGYNGYGQCDVSGWTDIVAVSAGNVHTVGLKADGTVVAVGNNEYAKCDVSGWRDIVAVSASDRHTVGLKADGTVVAVGRNGDGQCDVSGWTDIKLPSTSRYITVEERIQHILTI